MLGQRVNCLDVLVFLEFTFLDPSLEALVVPVLDLVVVAAWELLHQHGPLWADLLEELDKFDILLNSPLVFHNVRINPIQPPLSTLLRQTAWQMLSNVLPFGASVSLDDLGEDSVLLWSPSAIVIELSLTDQLIIALVAFKQGFAHLFGDMSEFLHTMQVDQEHKLIIFLFGPFGDFFYVVVLALALGRGAAMAAAGAAVVIHYCHDWNNFLDLHLLGYD